MSPQECRTVFNGMISKLAKLYPDPERSDPNTMLVTIEMHKLQALWEIAAQLAEINEKNPKVVM